MKAKLNPYRPSSRKIEPGRFVEERIATGMVSSLDPTDIPNGAATDLRNARIRYDSVLVRPYLRSLQEINFPDETPPVDTHRILGVHRVKYPNGTSRLYRFTTDGVRWHNGANWTSLATGFALADTDRIQVATLADKMVFSTNGALTLKSLTSVPAIADVKAGITYKYITGAYNRIVAANFKGGTNNTIKIEWSADGDVTKWESDDRTAGSALLKSGPSDIADDITGIKALSDNLIVFRKKSIWVGNRQASATAPFTFSALVNGVGCDLPYTIAEVQGGFMWADAVSGSVWFFNGNEHPTSVGFPNDESFQTQFKNITSTDAPHAVYDPLNNEYLLLLPQANVSAGTPIWVYNFRTKTWAYDTIDHPSCLWVADIALGYTPISSLIGPISGLKGTISSLGAGVVDKPAVGIGFDSDGVEAGDGGLFFYDDNLATGLGDQKIQNIAGSYSLIADRIKSIWTSKQFNIPTDEQHIGYFILHYVVRDRYNGLSGGGLFTTVPPIKFYYALDGEEIEGKPVYFSFEELDKVPINKIIKFAIPLNIRCTQFQFKLEFSLAHIKMVKFELHPYEAGLTRATR